MAAQNTPQSYNVTKGVITQQEKARGREFTPKQRKFLSLLIKNEFKNPTALMVQAGYKEASWAAVYALKDDIREIIEGILVGHGPTAAMTLVDVMTAERVMPAAGTKLAAAKEILDRIGITKEERVKHQHEHQGGIFIIPAKAAVEVIEGEYINVDA